MARNISPGERPPEAPRWLKAPFLRHGALALLAWGGDPPGTPRCADGAWPASRQAPSRELAGVPSIPDTWHGRFVTLDADWARFTEADYDEACSRLRRLGRWYV